MSLASAGIIVSSFVSNDARGMKQDQLETIIERYNWTDDLTQIDKGIKKTKKQIIKEAKDVLRTRFGINTDDEILQLRGRVAQLVDDHGYKYVTLLGVISFALWTYTDGQPLPEHE
jgi:Zn-finger domain-containing protein